MTVGWAVRTMAQPTGLAAHAEAFTRSDGVVRR
jgi:hypothetical protein